VPTSALHPGLSQAKVTRERGAKSITRGGVHCLRFCFWVHANMEDSLLTHHINNIACQSPPACNVAQSNACCCWTAEHSTAQGTRSMVVCNTTDHNCHWLAHQAAANCANLANQSMANTRKYFGHYTSPTSAADHWRTLDPVQQLRPLPHASCSWVMDQTLLAGWLQVPPACQIGSRANKMNAVLKQVQTCLSTNPSKPPGTSSFSSGLDLFPCQRSVYATFPTGCNGSLPLGARGERDGASCMHAVGAATRRWTIIRIKEGASPQTVADSGGHPDKHTRHSWPPGSDCPH
jgi:hypothetical protein